ncbi:site-specific integrase [Vibrio sp. SCSIO 43137]|uniref:site-specific integrase n=1 Tax=Vibrio sp. SCSIO 43137 TaxID=3021011 RepID=UPI002307C889|nr:site-specific integrase [Vibrio sp. SCSIO 43137]WCE31118.1 site-specific integrase [Vibrio sp. SCSIO 43137]
MYQVMKCDDEFYCLFDMQTTFPPLLSLRYCEGILHAKALNYQKYELDAVKAFYEFWLTKFGSTLDYSLHLSDYQDIIKVLDEIDAFWDYLLSGRELSNIHLLPIVSSLDKKPLRTSAARCASVIRFIEFLATTYLTPAYSNGSFKEIEKYRKSILLRLSEKKKKFNKYNRGLQDDVAVYRSLTKSQFSDFSKIFAPSLKNANSLNPFISTDIQLRNYIVMTLLSRYGLRVGEILLLQKQSFKPFISDPSKYLMLVRNLKNSTDSVDTRNRKPEIKTVASNREIEISSHHYKVIMGYYNRFRPSDTPHEFIVTSHRKPYAPLSYQSALDEFKACVRAFKARFPEHFDPQYAESIVGDISPHWLRHTWAYGVLSEIYEANKNKFKADGVISIKGVMEDSIDQLRALGGWSFESKMPQKYAKRFIAENANSTLLDIYNNNVIYNAIEEDWNDLF